MYSLPDLLAKLKTGPALTEPERQTAVAVAVGILEGYGVSLKLLNTNLYLSLLPLTQATSKEEHATQPIDQQVNFARFHAIKLAVIFNKYELVIAYLLRFAKNNTTSNQLIHDACLFTLPKSDNWSLGLWQGLIAHHKPNGPTDALMRLLPFAPKIERYVTDNKDRLAQNKRARLITFYTRKFAAEYEQAHSQTSSIEKENYINKKLKGLYKFINAQAIDLLSDKTSIVDLQIYAENCCYDRAHENPEVARAFFVEKITEEGFDLYLTLIPQDDPNIIPFVRIEGEEIAPSYKNFYLTKLDPRNFDAALLGRFTSCCQSIDDVGQEAVIHGITNPRGGFYVLREQGTNKILAQCWAWRADDGSIVYDSVESQIDFRKKNTMLIADFFILLAEKLVTIHGVKCVLVGLGGETPKELNLLNPIANAFMAEYDGYNDSHEQSILACDGLSLVKLFKLRNPSSLLKVNDRPITRTGIKLWCELSHTNKFSMDNYVSAYFSENTMTAKEYYAYHALVGEWRKQMHTFKANNFSAKIREYAKLGVNLAVPIRSGSILFKALALGLTEDVKWLVEQGVPVNVTNESHNTVLHVTYDLDMLRYFINKGARKSVTGAFGETPLHLAAQVGRLDLVEFWIEQGINIDQIGSYMSVTALYNAVTSGHLAVTQYLLERGATTDVVDKNGNSLLHVLNEFTPELYIVVIRLLVGRGANIEARSIGKAYPGTTPLHSAAMHGKKNFLISLITCGARIDAKDDEGNSPLHYASSMEVVDELIAAGADLHVKNNVGRTPLHRAVERGKDEVSLRLIECGANIHALDNNDYTPLYLGITKRFHGKAMSRMLCNGASTSQLTKDGYSALSLANAYRSHFFIRALKKIEDNKTGLACFNL